MKGVKERGVSQLDNSLIVSRSLLDIMSEIICGRRSCSKEGERKDGGLMDEKGAYAKGIQVCAPPHAWVMAHGQPAG